MDANKKDAVQDLPSSDTPLLGLSRGSWLKASCRESREPQRSDPNNGDGDKGSACNEVLL